MQRVLSLRTQLSAPGATHVDREVVAVSRPQEPGVVPAEHEHAAARTLHEPLTPDEIGDRVFGVETGGQDYGIVRWVNAGLTQWPWSALFYGPKPEWFTDPGEGPHHIHLVHGIAVGAAVT